MQAASGSGGYCAMRRLCVFCGSRTGGRRDYADAAQQLGTALARSGIGLVFGAGHIGMMGIVADAVLAGGGEAIGVIPQGLVDLELAHTRLTRLHIVGGMHERKALMADLADAFLALPGGYGTLEELFEIVTWKQLRLHHKPIGLYNVAGFFDQLLAWIDRAIAEDFVRPTHRELLVVGDALEALLDRLLPPP
jgi:uncharacterized protein (TIGR00730 family)